MRLGILGTDRWVEGVADSADARGDTLLRSPHISEPGSWEKFLDAASCDAVIIGADGWTVGRAEAVRTLVQVGRPMLVSQPLELSMLWAWEIEMIRQDAGGVMIPILPSRLHPFIGRLRSVVEAGMAGEGPIGVIESLELDRRLSDRRRVAVLEALARDADLVRVIVGEPERLSAFGVSPDAPTWNSLTVGFSGQSLVPVRWQVSAGGDASLGIALRGSTGSVVLEIPDDWQRSWTWSGPGCEDASGATFAPAAEVLRVLDASLGKGPPPGCEESVPPATWADAARAVELAETVPRSLAKGRAVDLHREEFSELGTFRGTMASLGCGLILGALVLVVGAAVLGGVAKAIGWDLGQRLAGAWPVVALACLGLFLVLQLLPVLMGGGRGHEEKS